MSSSRQPHTGGGSGSGPGTSSSISAASTTNSGSGTSTTNGNNAGNAVSSRTMGTEGERLSVPSLVVLTQRGNNLTLLNGRPGPSSGGSSSKKRHIQTPLYNGLVNSYEDKSNDFVW